MAKNKPRAKSLAVLGTGSDVGKSIIVAGLCRLFHRAGVRVAPFKAQNMSLNSFVTIEGGEIGRAQALQAQACGLSPHVDMNPILLKPESDQRSQVIVQGKVLAKIQGREYFEHTNELFHSVKDSYERLAADYELIVIEGAGSAAEVNLRDRDIVNWRVADMADAPVLLVANIDPGGVFAQVVGTLDLISPGERARVGGILINKFRGDQSLFVDGVRFLEARTGIPVLGVVPFMRDLELDQEDSISRAQQGQVPFSDKHMNIAVTLLPRMSNFTDFNALAAEPDVALRYARSPAELIGADVVIIPGSKNTIEDLEYLRHAGFLPAFQQHVEQARELVGICGGYQMLGREVCDPHEVESGGSVKGLGWLDVTTELMPHKTTRQIEAIVLDQGTPTDMILSGYYIHMGKTERMTGLPCFKIVQSRSAEHDIEEDGARSRDGLIWGTYIHGVFDSPAFRRFWLNRLRLRKGSRPLPLSVSIAVTERLQRQMDRWAEHLRQHLQWTSIVNMIGLKDLK
ncbi:MAG TPA: cobyric acid synthase [Nitrospiraceae bacterium]|nr:cobyric acid synthase [Nitrospiraceae bacterium]